MTVQAPQARQAPARRRRWGLVLFVLLALLGLLLLLALQRAPLLPAVSSGANAGLAAQARLLWAQVRPGAAPAGALRRTRLGERELNALLDQAALTHGGGWRGRLDVEHDHLAAQLAYPWRAGFWLNLQLRWDLREPTPGRLPPLVEARLGRLPLPPGLVQGLAERELRRRSGGMLDELLPMLEGWQASSQQLWLRWRWQPERAGAAVAALWSEAEREALLVQHTRWLQLARTGSPDAPLPLTAVLPPLAQAGLARMQQGSDAAVEMRALLVNLTLQTLGRDLGTWLPAARAQGQAPARQLLLAGRDDMAQHFLIATLLAWQGGQSVAKALGLAKELADARVGSGFSFNDLAADDAGNRMGALLARDPALVLAALASGLQEAAFFPAIDDLPEFLSEAEFRRRYGQVGSPAYRAQMETIRARIAGLPLYLGLSGP